MKLAMYIFINKELQMSSGKIAAQAVQASIGAFLITPEKRRKEWWDMGGHHAVYVLQAKNEQHLKTIQDYIAERGFKSSMMIDEGMTEIDAHQATALGVEIVDREDEHTDKTFSTFKLYRDKFRVILEVNE